MQWSTTDIHQIKAAIFDQAFIGKTRVSCPMGRVVAIRRRKGQLLAMIYGWGRWYPVEDVLIVVVAPQLLSTSLKGCAKDFARACRPLWPANDFYNVSNDEPGCGQSLSSATLPL